MKYLSRLGANELKGKRALVRLDLNVPLDDEGRVADTDADRIMKALPTLKFLADAGAKTVVISHIGRDPKESLLPVVQYMEQHMTVGFAPGLFTDAAKDMVEHMGDGHVVVLQNLRSDAREESNDEEFAKQLSTYGDLYVNDAFSVSHRAHASVVGIPKFLPSYAGLQMERELGSLSASFSPESPSILVLGGAKFETKLPVIEKFLPIVDHVVIGGALANSFFAAKGYEVGKSLVDPDASVAHLVANPKIIVPETVTVESETGSSEKEAFEVGMGEKIADIAPKGFDPYRDLFASARFVLWNGPMGNYENGFTKGSEALAAMIAESGAQSVVGGGDSVSLVERLGIAEKFGFVSTGGGAMLEYLANGTLPGIEALENSGT